MVENKNWENKKKSKKIILTILIYSRVKRNYDDPNNGYEKGMNNFHPAKLGDSFYAV